MRFEHDAPGRLSLVDPFPSLRDRPGAMPRVLAEYEYEPHVDPSESPRPSLLLRTPAGVTVTGHRPDDHVWHQGLSLAVPHIGAENFWGGPTYVDGHGYLALANNGIQRHLAFDERADGPSDVAQMGEELEWVTSSDDRLIVERRTLTAHHLDDVSWVLVWRSSLRNVASRDLAFGSPAAHGRAGAGYGGIFWRGPMSFSGGRILGPAAPEESSKAVLDLDDEALGRNAPWLAFVAPDNSASVTMLGGESSVVPWFARSAEYAGLGPAPFFGSEKVLPADSTLDLSAAVVLSDDTDHIAERATRVAIALAAELRHPVSPTPEHS